MTRTDVNGLNNLGIRGQLLFAPSDRMAITVALDATRQRPEGYAQVVAGVAPTLRVQTGNTPRLPLISVMHLQASTPSIG